LVKDGLDDFRWKLNQLSFDPGKPLIAFPLPFFAFGLKRKPVLIISGNLLNERSLVAD